MPILFESARFVGVHVVEVGVAADVVSFTVNEVVPLLNANDAGKIILTYPALFAIAPLAFV